MLHHRPVNRAEELLGVAICKVLLDVRAMSGSVSAWSVGAVCAFATVRVLANQGCSRLRHTFDRKHLAQGVASCCAAGQPLKELCHENVLERKAGRTA